MTVTYFVFHWFTIPIFGILEIRDYDRKLQNLVYQNYSRFIDAEDSFHKMGDNLQEMAQQAQILSDKVDTVDNATGQVDVHLGNRRERLDGISAVNKLLQKVFPFSSPFTSH